MLTPDPKPWTLVCPEIRTLHHREGQPVQCTLRLDGCTHFATDHCHVRTKASLGGNRKPPDIHAFYACRPCHEKQERRQAPWEDVLRAVFESQSLMMSEGFLKVGN